MTDSYPKQAQTASSPARRGAAVDLSSTDATFTDPPTALLVGVAGNITGQLIEDSADTVYPVQAGYQPLRFKTIRKTGTTATGIVALFA